MASRSSSCRRREARPRWNAIPTAPHRALQNVITTGRESLAEMRRLLDLVGRDPAAGPAAVIGPASRTRRLSPWRSMPVMVAGHVLRGLPWGWFGVECYRGGWERDEHVAVYGIADG
jgi:hypothetical protein